MTGTDLGSRILKVNHAGEFGAISIYTGQILVARLFARDLVPELVEFRSHERGHRAIFGAELKRIATYTHAIYKYGSFAGRDLPFYSRRTANLGLRYQRAARTFNLDAFSQSRQHSPGSPGFDPAHPTGYQTVDTPNGDYGDIPGWTTWNVRGEYAFGPSLSNLRLGVGVKNLFDRRYFTRSTDNNDGLYAGQPRTYYVQASFDF